MWVSDVLPGNFRDVPVSHSAPPEAEASAQAESGSSLTLVSCGWSAATRDVARRPALAAA